MLSTFLPFVPDTKEKYLAWCHETQRTIPFLGLNMHIYAGLVPKWALIRYIKSINAMGMVRTINIGTDFMTILLLYVVGYLGIFNKLIAPYCGRCLDN